MITLKNKLLVSLAGAKAEPFSSRWFGSRIEQHGSPDLQEPIRREIDQDTSDWPEENLRVQISLV